MAEYTAIADQLAADIAGGRLAAGTRLPPQREFARTHQVAVSTASRVYRELARRGLTVGEVGRGTYVRAPAPAGEPALVPAEGAGERGHWVDLAQNYCLLPDQPDRLAPVLAELADPARGLLADALRPLGTHATPAARAALAAMVTRPDWAPSPDHLLVTGNGRQAVAAGLAAVARPGDRIGADALTYPVIKPLTRQLGLTLVPFESDEHGPTPAGVRAAHRAHGLTALYLQPTLHNPTTVTMPAARRAELAALLDELDLHAVEDGVYSFLRDDTPLAAAAPQRVFYADSLSKRLAPGLTAGVLVAPAALVAAASAGVRAGGWAVSHLALTAVVRCIADGTIAALVAAKRADAAARQRILAEALHGLAVQTDPAAYHCWWSLPAPWRADTFVAAAARRGIACTPAAAFATGAHTPAAVRLALASPEITALEEALRTLATLACRPDDDVE